MNIFHQSGSRRYWMITGLLLLLCSFDLISATPTNGCIILKINDKDGKPLPYASVFVERLDQYYLTDEGGMLSLSSILLKGQGTNIRISYIGKVTLNQSLTAEQIASGKTLTFILNEENLYLPDVQVNAVRESRQSNSSIVINRNSIDNIQAYSLADVMQALPGKAILNIDPHQTSFLTLRSALSGATENPLDIYNRSKINDFTRNAAFGIAFIVDGTPISNNVNMQLDSYGKWGGIKMFDRRFNTDNNEHVANGNDLRLLPASSVESIEIISGVAPVKYGDLSHGAVIINRRAGITPLYGSVKVQYDILNASAGKGLSLGNKYGLLHFHVDYQSSTKDKRDRLKTNSRLALNTTWTKTLNAPLKWDNTLSIDLSQNIDGLKNDPDEVLNRTKTEQSAVKLAIRGTFQPPSTFLDRIDYNASFSLSRQYDMHEEYIQNFERRIITDDYTSGLHETDIAPPRYVSKLEIEGIPLLGYANIEGRKSMRWKEGTHLVSFGLFGKYEANLGKGKIFDPEHPFHDGGIGGRGDRSYDYKNRIRLLQYGAYLQDKMTLPLGEHHLSVTGGLRLETQRNRFVISPRVSSTYFIGNNLSFNGAYGISYKIPPTAYLYPENVYFDRLVFSHYHDEYQKRLYLYQTKVIDPTNRNLRSPYTHSFESGVTYRTKGFNTSLTGYLKIDQDGISSLTVIDTMYVQYYKKAGDAPNGRPLYTPDGERKLYIDSYYKPENRLYSSNCGIELVGNIDEIKPLGLSCNYSLVYNYSYYYSKGDRSSGKVDMEQEAVAGIYGPIKNSTHELVSTVSLTKHISVIGLILNVRLQNFWLRHYHRFGYSIYPVGYYDRNFNMVRFEGNEAQDPKWAYLRLSHSEPLSIRQPILIPNCHLRVSKELGSKLRLSCYIYNVFNYRPYTEMDGIRRYFNQAPTISMDISYKI